MIKLATWLLDVYWTLPYIIAYIDNGDNFPRNEKCPCATKRVDMVIATAQWNIHADNLLEKGSKAKAARRGRQQRNADEAIKLVTTKRAVEAKG